MYDVTIIGGGIVGTTIARELSRYDLKIILLEKNNDIATGATKANSAIVHAGYDADHQTLKAKLNVQGNFLYTNLCRELSVPLKRIGSLVCAFNQEEIITLKKLFENGKALNIPGLIMLSGLEVRQMEPNLNQAITRALYATTAGITEPWELAIACMENAMDNGASLKLNSEVTHIKQLAQGFVIFTAQDEIQSRYIVNCAGVYADQVFGLVTDQPGFTITPRRGQYFLLDKSEQGLVQSIIFPCPSKSGKGTLIAPTVDGNILIGPDAEDLSGKQKEGTQTSAGRLQQIKTLAEKLVPNIPFHQTITTFSGIRAEPSGGDFIIEESSIAGFINTAGIKSPGLSAAPAIALKAAAILNQITGGLQPNLDFNPIRRPRIKLEKLTDHEKKDLIQKNPGYGNIICRCEMISEGEIIDAIHRNAGGRTLNGIKRRVRPGAGRCQGGFCAPRVMEILARELNIDIQSVKLEAKTSHILSGQTKQCCPGEASNA